MRDRTFIASVLSSLTAFALVGACGGKTVGAGNGTGSSTGTSSSRSSESSSRQMGSSSASSGGSGGQCVTVTLSPSDTTCATDSDCTDVTTGQICPTSCECGGTAANNAAATRIQNEVAGISTEECPCAEDGEPRCIAGQCTLCGFGPNGSSTCGNDGGLNDFDGGIDASPDGDFTTGTFTDDAGATCVDIDLSTFDQTCQTANDCISIFTGQLCVPSDCPCQSAFVNASGQGRYDQTVNSLPPSAISCSCPDMGPPACIAGMCVTCGFGPNQPAGCPGSGP